MLTRTAIYTISGWSANHSCPGDAQLMQDQRPDVVIVPNGSMLEFGITFKVADYLGIPAMTYEFGEQSERLWMAQNEDVMRQDTTDLWGARSGDTANG